LERVFEFQRDQARLRARCSELKSKAALIGNLIETATDADGKERAARIIVHLLQSRDVDFVEIQKSMTKEIRESSMELVKLYLSRVDRDLKAAEAELEQAKERAKLALKSYQESLKSDFDDERFKNRFELASELRDAAQKRLREAQSALGGEPSPKK
jgi:hypothetical protein